MNKAERLYYELEGVIVDIDNGLGFDEVCYNTVKHTQAELLELAEEEHRREDGLTDQFQLVKNMQKLW
jgi:hypothetical protein